MSRFVSILVVVIMSLTLTNAHHPQAVIAKPEPDFTDGSEDLRWIGWYLPSECNNFTVGSVLSIFCPDLRYILHMQEVIDRGFLLAHNFLDENEELKQASLHSLS